MTKIFILLVGNDPSIMFIITNFIKHLNRNSNVCRVLSTYFNTKDPVMAYLIDMSDISKEREFATGCLYWIISQRNPELPVDFLSAQQNEDSDEESDQVDINQALSRYQRIYEAINAYAVEHIEVIEAKYRSFFTEHRDLVDPHVKNFMELVSRYAYGLYEKPFSYEIIVNFCAHLSVFGFMSYQEKRLEEVVKYAISSITYMLKYYAFDNSKYTELGLFAENFF